MIARYSLALVFVPLLGCNGNIAVPKTAPVSGKVLFRGKPAAGVLVTFHPKFDMGRIRFEPSGLTDKEGKYRLSTAAPNDGAPPGEYIATFKFPVVKTDRANSGIEVEVDAWNGKYADATTSKYPVRVHPETNEIEPFNLN